MLLRVWESISSMWCQKALSGGTGPMGPAHLESSPPAIPGLAAPKA